MRRFVAAVLVAVVALALVGCGGEEPADNTAAPVAPPPVIVVEEDDALIPDRSAEESAVFEPFPINEEFPASLLEAVKSKQPTIIVFIDSAQKDTNDLRSEVDTVVKENQGLVDLFTYDLGKYAVISPDGVIDVDQKKLQEDETAKGAIELAKVMDVNFTPYIIITDDQGHVIYKHSGFIDFELLDAQVQRVTEE